ncbi:hypothetical protein AVEN_16582-1 [Araneus ventricosus]|uniref:Uncharacterized protein n=1 Tax=Araneus ventricosus TaxID=182803 RepID=A0A4Y2JPW0_ARAVE|nr:hypothetical protein AVEN_16582-1 [Araneus ventricosus]
MTSDVACTRPTCTTDLQWDGVPNMEPFGPRSQDLTTRPSRPARTFLTEKQRNNNEKKGQVAAQHLNNLLEQTNSHCCHPEL